MKEIYFFLGLAIALINTGCSGNHPSTGDNLNYYQIQGEAQGTTYTIIFEATSKEEFIKKEIDSLLYAYDLQNSIYMEESIISQINRAEDSIIDLQSLGKHDHFKTCFNVSKKLFQLSEGAFNPAVYPLVSFWGFYKENFNFKPDSLQIDSLLQTIDFSNTAYALSEDQLSKKSPHSKLDFNALAQGHSVDVIADFIAAKHINNYMIELGGEVRCLGLNPDGDKWKIGIDQPVDGANPGEHDFQFIAQLSDQSLATSGNYRKFYEINGQKYSHTIDPLTGYPVRHNLLSVTVIMGTCVEADAFATTFMVLGIDQSKAFIETHKDLDINAYFVYDSSGIYQTYMTPGFEAFVLKQ